MGCIDSTNFVVLINGQRTSFFQSNRGIRQGCLLLPLLFLMVIEGLSRLIDTMKSSKIKGIKVSSSTYITHLLFVDDVFIFGIRYLAEFHTFKGILDPFLHSFKISH